MGGVVYLPGRIVRRQRTQDLLAWQSFRALLLMEPYSLALTDQLLPIAYQQAAILPRGLNKQAHQLHRVLQEGHRTNLGRPSQQRRGSIHSPHAPHSRRHPLSVYCLLLPRRGLPQQREGQWLPLHLLQEPHLVQFQSRGLGHLRRLSNEYRHHSLLSRGSLCTPRRSTQNRNTPHHLHQHERRCQGSQRQTQMTVYMPDMYTMLQSLSKGHYITIRRLQKMKNIVILIILASIGQTQHALTTKVNALTSNNAPILANTKIKRTTDVKYLKQKKGKIINTNLHQGHKNRLLTQDEFQKIQKVLQRSFQLSLQSIKEQLTISFVKLIQRLLKIWDLTLLRANSIDSIFSEYIKEHQTITQQDYDLHIEEWYDCNKMDDQASLIENEQVHDHNFTQIELLIINNFIDTLRKGLLICTEEGAFVYQPVIDLERGGNFYSFIQTGAQQKRKAYAILNTTAIQKYKKQKNNIKKDKKVPIIHSSQHKTRSILSAKQTKANTARMNEQETNNLQQRPKAIKGDYESYNRLNFFYNQTYEKYVKQGAKSLNQKSTKIRFNLPKTPQKQEQLLFNFTSSSLPDSSDNESNQQHLKLKKKVFRHVKSDFI